MKGGSGFANLAPEASKGIVNRLLSGAAEKAGSLYKWAAKEPIAAAIGLNAVAGAFSPDQLDIEEYRRENDEEDRRRRYANQEAGSRVTFGVRPANTQARYVNGLPINQGGIINRSRGTV